MSRTWNLPQLNPCRHNLSSLSPVRLPTPEPADDLELVWISIKLGSESFLLGLLYRPPSSSVAYWAKLGQAMETHNIDSFDGCLLLGDFNVDLTPSITGNYHRTRLLDIASDFNLEQLVQSLTRPSQNNPNSGSINDLVFTNRADFISSIYTVQNPIHSDHLAVMTTFRSTRPAPSPAILRTFLQTRRGDFEHLNT